MRDFNKVFLDTAPLIYFLDKESPLCSNTARIFSFFSLNKCEIITSSITCMEYLVYPYRNRDVKAVNAFWRFVKESNLDICNINEAIAEEAAKIRARYRSFKAFDSIQLACAVQGQCELFLTNDKQLRQFPDISCVTVEEWSNEV
ncbi:MAG: PIN domain-containing protein [Selenomonadaceae bacterium]|nr:PIN domain-containing protein [Selenomonadaceae bacterium]